jgi:hypothetical protein
LNQGNIRVIPWPSNSLDINIIKNIWHILKSELYRQVSGKTRNEVIAKGMQIWENDEDARQTGINGVSSKPKRIQTLYDERGGATKY